jgi:hypothetical protein
MFFFLFLKQQRSTIGYSHAKNHHALVQPRIYGNIFKVRGCSFSPRRLRWKASRAAAPTLKDA